MRTRDLTSQALLSGRETARVDEGRILKIKMRELAMTLQANEITHLRTSGTVDCPSSLTQRAPSSNLLRTACR